MKINVRNQCNNLNFKQRKIPRYLYHFTTPNSYELIKKTGNINISENDEYLCGVFLFELSNFIKNWGINKDWNNKNLAFELIKRISGFSQSIVLLKIPVKNLDKDKIFIRSQNRLFNAKEHYKDVGLEHLGGEITASMSKKYKHKKEAIEYIYEDEINISKILDVFQCDVKELFDVKLREKSDIASIMLKLFNNRLGNIKPTSELLGLEKYHHNK